MAKHCNADCHLYWMSQIITLCRVSSCWVSWHPFIDLACLPVWLTQPTCPVCTGREYLRGKYHCTIDLLFDWFGISYTTTDNFCFYLLNRQIQTSQTGGQQYSDTSPFSIPWYQLLSLMFCWRICLWTCIPWAIYIY